MARYKAGSLARLTRIHELLGRPRPFDGDDQATVRGELHTLKGESRMLGLVSLAALAHAVEDAVDGLGRSPSDRALALVTDSLGLIQGLLEGPLEERPEAEADLARGRELLARLDQVELEALAEKARLAAGGGDEHDDDRAGDRVMGEERPGKPPEPVSDHFEPAPSFSMVPTAAIDELCERLESLRISLAGLRSRTNASQAEGFELGQTQREVEELAVLAWGLRLVSVEPALQQLSSHAVELAEQLGKRVRIRVDAGDAQLERSLLERLEEPLLHLLRNALDHGIEAPEARGDKPAEARLDIIARAVGAEVELSLSDDGQGIDLDAVRSRGVERGLLDASTASQVPEGELLALLFESGFSTARTVSELSGRGVGLDVVRRIIEGLGGHVTVSSERGRGTRFVVRVPATVSRERILVLELAGVLWGLPSRRIEHVVRLRDALCEQAGNPTALVDGEHLPLLSLARLLGVGVEAEEREVLLCEHAGRRWAIASPALVGEFELFRRPLGPTLASVGLASASAMLDDGRLVLLLEPAALLGRHGRVGGRFTAPATATTQPRVLVVDDSPIIRELMLELLANAGLDVRVANDGLQALSMLDSFAADLVLTDVEMPALDGFGLLSRIRERDSELPVVMVTTRGSAADRRRASELGADAYLVKSAFQQEDLLRTVSRFVEVSS
nr:response regulator [Pseudenhygromyxa sp. WMMC2535]